MTNALPFDDGFTKVPNVIFDLMPHISSGQFAVLLAIVRRTYGWQKTEDIISLSQIAVDTGLSQRTVYDALYVLTERCFVLRRSASPDDTSERGIKRKPSQQFWYTVNLSTIETYMQILHRNGDIPMQNLHMNSETPMQNLHMNSETPMQNLHTNGDIPMQNLHTQKKENKEKEFKETPFSFSLNSSGNAESSPGGGAHAESKAPPNAPSEAIDYVLSFWQSVRGGSISNGERSAVRKLCAKYAPKDVHRAMLTAKEKGKADGPGYVAWVLENDTPSQPVDWSKYGGGIPDYMRDDKPVERTVYTPMQIGGGDGAAEPYTVFLKETWVNGKKVRETAMPKGFVPPNQNGGLSSALASV